MLSLSWCSINKRVSSDIFPCLADGACMASRRCECVVKPTLLLGLKPDALAGIVGERQTTLLAPTRIQTPCCCEEIRLHSGI
eukprot:511763-Rhodomonas_salina.1